MEYRRDEIGAGLVIVLGLALLLLMVAMSGNVQDLFRDKKDFIVRFGRAEDVEVNTPVKQGGMLVGKIKNIRVGIFKGQNKILLTLTVFTDTVVKRDSKVTIKSPLMGEKYVDIGLGTPDSPALMLGDALDGVEGLSLDEMTDTVVAVIEDLQSIVTDIKKITGDPQFQQNIKNMMANLESATSELDELIKRNSGNIDATLRDLRQAANHLDGAIKQVDNLVRDIDNVVAENRRDIRKTMRGLSDLPGQIEYELATLEQSITNLVDENDEDIRKIFENLEKISQNLVEMTDELKEKPWRIIRK